MKKAILFCLGLAALTGCSGVLDPGASAENPGVEEPATLKPFGEYYLWSGDILLNPQDSGHRELIQALQAGGASSKGFKKTSVTEWPKGVIPYFFDGPSNFTAAERQTIRDAMNAVESGVPSSNNLGGNYIRFIEDNNGLYSVRYQIIRDNSMVNWASSTLGFTSGAQLRIGLNMVQKWLLVHELGHAIGMSHEHQRYDRNNYITINTANIDPTQTGQFDIIPQSISQINFLTYDYDSIMHYGRYAFSQNGQPTITVPGGQAIGQRDHLSNQDNAWSQLLYPKYGYNYVPQVYFTGKFTNLGKSDFMVLYPKVTDGNMALWQTRNMIFKSQASPNTVPALPFTSDQSNSLPGTDAWNTGKWFTGNFSPYESTTKLMRVYNDGGLVSMDLYFLNGTKSTVIKQQGNFANQNDLWFTGVFDGNAGRKTNLMHVWGEMKDGRLQMCADLYSLGAYNTWTRTSYARYQGDIWSGQRWFPGDVNGDGRDDLVKIWGEKAYGTGSVQMVADVHESYSTGLYMRRWATYQGDYWDTQDWRIGDFDGDHKADLMKFWNDNGNMTADVHVSRVSYGPYGEPYYYFSMQRWATSQGGIWAGQRWFLGDFNGDGKTDLMKIWQDQFKEVFADFHLSSGTSFSMSRATSYVWSSPFTGTDLWSVEDFDGNGKSDLLKVDPTGKGVQGSIWYSSGSQLSYQRVDM